MCHVASAINNKRALFHATVQPSPATKTSFKSKLGTAQFHKYFKQQNALTGTLLPIKKHKLNVILLIKPGPKRWSLNCYQHVSRFISVPPPPSDC